MNVCNWVYVWIFFRVLSGSIKQTTAKNSEVLEYNTMPICKYLSVFRKCFLPPTPEDEISRQLQKIGIYVGIYQLTGHPIPEQMNLQLLNIVIHTDACDVAIGSQLFVLSRRHAEYVTSLKKVNVGRAKNLGRHRPVFHLLNQVLYYGNNLRAVCMSVFVTGRTMTNRVCGFRISFVFFSAVLCFHSHSSFSCISYVSGPLRLLLSSLSVRRKCYFVQGVHSVRNKHIKTVFYPSVCATGSFSQNLLKAYFQ